MQRAGARLHRANGGTKARWIGAAAMGTIGVAVLMVLMGAASASAAPTVVNTVRTSAPYTGAWSSPSSSTSTGGCATSVVVTAPFWHAHTGMGGFSGTSSARSCPGQDSYGSTDATYTTYVPIAVLAGHDHITAKWWVQVAGGETFHLGSCSVTSGGANFSYCYVGSSSELSGGAYLMDLTTGNYLASPTNTWNGTGASAYFEQYCSYGNCSAFSGGNSSTFGYSGCVTWNFNVHGLVASHQYELVQWFSGYESSYVEGYGATIHGHASAWLNAGTFGNGETLKSVVVT
jgi:hypothetical protein